MAQVPGVQRTSTAAVGGPHPLDGDADPVGVRGTSRTFVLPGADETPWAPPGPPAP